MIARNDPRRGARPPAPPETAMPDAAPRSRRPALPWRAFALLLLATVPACAAAPPAPSAPAPAVIAAPPEGKPPPALRHAADIQGPACVAEHRAMVEEAMPVARARAAEALRFAREQPEHAHLRRWFGTAPHAEVVLRLERIAAWLDQPPAFKLLCNDPAGCRGWRMAYAAPTRRIIGLCPGFFRAAMEGFDSRWGTLLHEASHLAAGTGDHAYGQEAALILAKADPARAAENADNYEYFAESLPR